MPTRASPSSIRPAAPAVCVLLLACADPGPVRYDPDAVIAAALAFETDFERLDQEAIETVHPFPNGLISIWADPETAALFRTLDPDDLEQSVTFPPGSILVKQNFDLDGTERPERMILAKFESGYNPRANDWFFAVVDRDGNVINDLVGNGGEVEMCADCHDSMAGDSDFVIGLESDNLRVP